MRRFCDAYIANGKKNAAQAYRDAGYDPKTDHAAAASAQKLLTKADIKEYISQHSRNLQEKAEQDHESKLLTAEDLCKFWAGVIDGSIGEKVYDREAQGMIDSPAKISDRLKASELYGKMLNVFTTNVNVQGAVPIVIKDDVKE